MKIRVTRGSCFAISTHTGRHPGAGRDPVHTGAAALAVMEPHGWRLLGPGLPRGDERWVGEVVPDLSVAEPLPPAGEGDHAQHGGGGAQAHTDAPAGHLLPSGDVKERAPGRPSSLSNM